MAVCPTCGANAPSGARFCPECGAAIILRPDERRLVTVLMADIVGFTSLSERADPEHVKNLVDQCFQRLVADVVSYGGHLDKIVGDQLVAQFGAPVAHEDDAERAVRCALAMQSTLTEFAKESGSRFDLRIGANTGEVLVGAMRAGGDATVMGDVVNIASRLQTSAQPGQVIVGPITYEATRASFMYESLGAITVKNRSEPIEAWIAIAATSLPGRRRRRVKRAPLVGRDPELGLFRNTFRIAMRGRAQLIEIYGEAGVGKSRLAMEFAQEARDTNGALVLVGQCVPYGNSSAYGPLAEAVRGACSLDRDSPMLDSRHTVTATVAAALDLAIDCQETDRVVDGLLFLTDGFSRPGVDISRARDESRRSVGRFFERLASTRPVILVMSDVQWADADLRDALDKLLARVRSLPFVLITTARPDFVSDSGFTPGQHNQVVLHLDGLSAESSASLVRELVGTDVDADFIELLQERSGGNPFFVEELVALAFDANNDGEIDATSDALRSLPATLHGLVAARLDALSAEERSMLEDFAVVGSSGTTTDALALTDRPDGDRIARALSDRDLLEMHDGEFNFRSELVRDVAYGTLTRAERARRHNTIAQRLSDGNESNEEAAALHLATAAELVVGLGTVAEIPEDVLDRALEALLRATRRAQSSEHTARAGKLAERILELADPADSARVWPSRLARARMLDAERNLPDAREDALWVLEAAREASDDGTVADALLVLGQVESNSRRYDEAERYYGEALTTARSLQDESKAAEALRALGMARLFQGSGDSAEALSSDALAAFRNAGDRRGEAWALQNLAWIAFIRGATARAESRLEQSAALFEEIGDWGGLGWARGLLGFVRYNQGRLDDAEILAKQVGGEFDSGERWGIEMLEVLLSAIALWRGRSAECVDRGRGAIEFFHSVGDNWSEVQATTPVIRALTKLGRFSEAEDLLRSMTPAASALADPSMRRIGGVASAAVHLERGDGEGAIEALSKYDFEHSVSVADSDIAQLHALAYLQCGRNSEAIAIIEPAYKVAEHDGARAALGGLFALALVAIRDPEAALDVAMEVTDIRAGTYMDKIFLHWAMGYAYAQLGKLDETVLHLDEAHRVAFDTDSKIDRAIAGLARATAFEFLGISTAHEARNESNLQLHSLGIEATGWVYLFANSLTTNGA